MKYLERGGPGKIRELLAVRRWGVVKLYTIVRDHPADLLGDAFHWDSTDEGRGYWEDVWVKLRRGQKLSDEARDKLMIYLLVTDKDDVI